MSARVESGSEFESPPIPSTGPAGEHGFDPPAWQRAGCLRNPCSADPDPALFFASPELRQFRDTLLATVRGESASLSVVTGPAGIGKTALLRELETALLQGRRRVAYLGCMHAEVPWRDMLQSAPGPMVLLLDDVEHCGEPWFDELERWVAAGAEGRPGSHIVVSARPGATARLQRLAEVASQAGLATESVSLEPLDAVMVGEFLAHRLWRSGFTGPWPLAEATVHRIADLSGGIPARILRLAGAEFEAAWAEEAVFAPRRIDSAISPPPPVASMPAIAGPPTRRRLLSDSAARTAIAATALLAVAGTAGWLAWRTVETARVGLVEVAPPATPPDNADAVAPPARGIERLASATAAPMSAEPKAPPPAAETVAPVSPVMLAARTTEPAPQPAPKSPPVVAPMPAAAPRAMEEVQAIVAPPLAEDMFQADPPTSAEIAAAGPVAAETAVEEDIPQAAVEQSVIAPPGDPPPIAVDQVTVPLPIAQGTVAQEPLAQEPVEPVQELPSSSPPAEALPDPAPAPTEPPPAEPGDAAGGASAEPPKAEAPPSAAPPQPAAAPVTEPSAGVPPAAPAVQLSPEQIASYVRRGDEYVQTGDIAAARLWYERAALAGDAGAMQALGRTYDARMLRQWGVVGMPADEARAEEWYRKAAAAERRSLQRN